MAQQRTAYSRRARTRASLRGRLAKVAARHKLDGICALGSRAAEVRDLIEGTATQLASGGSDVDIAVLPRTPLSLDVKVHLAIELEDLFGVERVDLAVLPEASPTLAFDAVCGELIYVADPIREAEYQLYVMRRAADLAPLQAEWEKTILGF